MGIGSTKAAKAVGKLNLYGHGSTAENAKC